MESIMRIGIVVLLIVMLVGCITPHPPETPATPSPPQARDNPLSPAWPLHQHQLFQQYAAKNEITLDQAKQFFEQAYGITEDGIYSQLPTPTSQFLQDVNTLHYGDGIAINSIPPESYLQPEFYPTFTTAGIKTWIEAPAQPPNTFGFSSTPAEQQATLTDDTNGFTTTLFLGSSWGVTYYQGVAFRYTISPSADIHLTFDPPAILAGPTFPQFTPEWMHKITIEGSIGPTTPPGTYTLSIFPADAPIETQQQWYEQHPRYINGNGLFGPSNGFATLTLTIPPKESN